MIEMMAQMGAMMQMMQRTTTIGDMPNPPVDPPNFQMPRVSRIRGALEGGHEVHNTTEKLVGKGRPSPAEYDQVNLGCNSESMNESPDEVMIDYEDNALLNGSE
ncbi:hypothetical protein MA16_Dca019078 [Dendrobium catenatum]|uniref:Uncharacterized protein n=1 Tax=Dendrobium catenatum TaxID=906689 RepID=A0A2I0VU86_9ASPA|nr:hypothetical protein MA16_Dca019078 [Dendrobium catenatum]